MVIARGEAGTLKLRIARAPVVQLLSPSRFRAVCRLGSSHKSDADKNVLRIYYEDAAKECQMPAHSGWRFLSFSVAKI